MKKRTLIWLMLAYAILPTFLWSVAVNFDSETASWYQWATILMIPVYILNVVILLPLILCFRHFRNVCSIYLLQMMSEDLIEDRVTFTLEVLEQNYRDFAPRNLGDGFTTGLRLLVKRGIVYSQDGYDRPFARITLTRKGAMHAAAILTAQGKKGAYSYLMGKAIERNLKAQEERKSASAE